MGDFEEAGQQYLVLEYVSGGSLEKLLKQQPALPLEQVLTIALDVCDALTAAHKSGIWHRDLKPGNILLDENGKVRLTDFGIAHIRNAPRLTETGDPVGTFEYMAPEVLNPKILGDRPIDGRIDIWSLGATLFKLVTGQTPFARESVGEIVTAILSEPTPDLSALSPDVPESLTYLVNKMLEKDPVNRIASIREIGFTLETIRDGRPVNFPTGDATAQQPLSDFDMDTPRRRPVNFQSSFPEVFISYRRADSTEYDIIRIMAQRDTPERVWRALRAFWQIRS